MAGPEQLLPDPAAFLSRCAPGLSGVAGDALLLHRSGLREQRSYRAGAPGSALLVGLVRRVRPHLRQLPGLALRGAGRNSVLSGDRLARRTDQPGRAESEEFRGAVPRPALVQSDTGPGP